MKLVPKGSLWGISKLETLTLRLHSNGPTDLALCSQPTTEIQADRAAFRQDVLYRVCRMGGMAAYVKATALAEDKLAFEVSSADGNPLPPRSVVETAIRRKFSLDLNLPVFYAFAGSLPGMASMAEQQRGLRPILKDTLFEALCLAVVDQQVNAGFAARLKQRLLARYGHDYRLEGVMLTIFPLPEQLAPLPEDALCELQLTRNKSSYIIGLARRFSSDSRWEQLAGSDEEVVRELQRLRGVGPWTAEYAAMMGLGLVDTLPAADIGLMRSVQRKYRLPQRPDEAQVRGIAADWSPWRGLITFYLWHGDDRSVLTT